MKNFSFLILFLFSFSFVLVESQDDGLNFEENKIDFRNENFEKIINKLKNKEKIEILHIGDSHIQMGEFSKGIINRLLDDSIKMNKGWFLPNLVFPDLYLNKELTKSSVVFSGEDIRSFSHHLVGITGRSFTTKNEKFKLNFNFQNKLSSFEILLEDKDDFELLASKKSKISSLKIGSSEKITLNFKREIKNFKLKFQKAKNPNYCFYAFRGDFSNQKNTSSYSNFGVSGAKFTDFFYSNRFYSQLELIKADLIFLTLGTNDSYSKSFNLEEFSKQLVYFIRKIKEVSPQTELVFMSAPDTKFNGEKPSNLKAINREIEKICQAENVAFWNWFKIMGGENSILIWDKKQLSDKDLLHFSSKGYHLLGKLFAEALILKDK